MLIARSTPPYSRLTLPECKYGGDVIKETRMIVSSSSSSPSPPLTSSTLWRTRCSARRRFTSEAFVREFAKNRVRLSKFQGAVLGAGAAALSLADPFRADMIACLAETTGREALSRCLARMRSSPEGSRILDEKPRIKTTSLDLASLAALPDDTLGKTYHDFLRLNRVSPDSRDPVKFVDDVELAYVMQRYREVHDILHAVLLMPTTMLGEVSVKWVEALQTGLPMCLGGAIFGAVRLRPRQRRLYLEHHLPWAIATGKSANFLLAVHYEKRWEQRLEDFHAEMKIVPLALRDTTQRAPLSL